MERLRLAIKKDGAIQFLSHLDFARAVRYVIIRANLPICYSEGFNPHMKMSFASALGVGVSADVEYMDMELETKIPVPEVMERMNTKSPHGFAVLDGKYIDPKATKLMAAANYATYMLLGPTIDGATEEAVQTALQAFNTATEVMYEKVSVKGKKKVRLIDVKQHVIEPITGTLDGKNVVLEVGIFQTAEGAIKPTQVWEVLGKQFGLPIQTDMMLARRRGIYHRENGVNQSLFDI